MTFLADIFGGGNQKANDFNAQVGSIYQPSDAQQASVQNQQQAFANSLQQQAAGTGGPSAADAMLKNAQQQQLSQANAMAASQQGNVNAGLASRNAAMTASQGAQGLAGQAAQMRNQEQLQAQGLLGGQLGGMFQQGMGAQNANQQNSLAAQNINANVALGNAERQSKAGAGLLGGISGMAGMAGGGKAHGGMIQGYADGGGVATPVVAPVETAPSPNFIAALGKVMGKNQGSSNKDPIYQGSHDIGAGLGSMIKNAGSFVGDFLTGGSSDASPAAEPNKAAVAAGYNAPRSEANAISSASPNQVYSSNNFQGSEEARPLMAKGGDVVKAANGLLVKKPLPPMKKVAALVSPGEIYLSPDKVQEVLKGADPMRVGHHIPGKAKTKGDSYANDTVHASLEEGGVVVPRHVTQHKMAPEKAAAFVRRAVAKKGAK